MMTTATSAQVPVKGTVFTLPGVKFTGYNGPYQLRVTSVKGETIYFRHPLWHADRLKISLALFASKATVVSTPEAQDSGHGQTMTADQCQALHQRAHAAGMKAGEAATPTPMIVTERENPWDDASPVKRVYAPVMDGPCGFAYVTVRPGNSSFARWLKAHAGGFKGYHGGVQVSVRAFGQSLERKTAYAAAYAEVCQGEGLRVTYESRMD